MEEELCTIPKIIQLMREIGLMTNFMGLEHSITKILKCYNRDSILEISM
jgi:hypothetical protein